MQQTISDIRKLSKTFCKDLGMVLPILVLDSFFRCQLGPDANTDFDDRSRLSSVSGDCTERAGRLAREEWPLHLC